MKIKNIKGGFPPHFYLISHPRRCPQENFSVGFTNIRKKEAALGGSASHSAEGKIDEMAKLVKILTAKLNKLELERNSSKPVQEGERNPNNQNQFRRQFAPRFIPRE